MQTSSTDATNPPSRVVENPFEPHGFGVLPINYGTNGGRTKEAKSGIGAIAEQALHG